MSTSARDFAKYFRADVASMSPYIPGEQPQAGKFIKLNTNENPYPPSPLVVQAISHAAENRLERYPDPLATSFRMAAADVYGLTPDHFLAGNGSDDILTIVTRAFVSPGRSIRFPFPSYILYRTLAQLQGATWEELPFQPDYALDPTFFQSHDLLNLVYLPHLDYNLQRRGAFDPAIQQDLRDIDLMVGNLIEFFNGRDVQVILLSEYCLHALNYGFASSRSHSEVSCRLFAAS